MRDEATYAEFRESIYFSCPRHRSDVELFKAKIKRKQFPSHIHEGFVIGLVENGVEKFHYRGVAHLAGPGSLILFNPEELHTGQAGSEDGVVYKTLQVPQTAIRKIFDQDFYFGDPILVNPALVKQLSAKFSILECETLSEATWNDWMDGFLIDVVFAAKGNFSGFKSIASKHNRVFDDIISYINNNLGEHLIVKNIASSAGYSYFHFIRLFRDQLGVTPHTYIQARRVALAKRLLHDGWKPADVAVISGFVDQSHLTRWLRACYGVTPGTYQTYVNRPIKR